MTQNWNIGIAAGAVVLGTALGAFWLLVSDQEQNVQNGQGQDYLREEESVTVTSPEDGQEETIPVEEAQVRYVEVRSSCDHNYENGECVKVYAGPGTEHEQVARLRTGMTLRVGAKVVRDGVTWYRITFDNQWLRYPERVEHDWYVRATDVSVLYDEGVKTTWEDGRAQTDKRIIIDRSSQTLSAYDGDTLFLETPISTGVELSPTPLGTYEVFKKTPSRYMQGPIEGLEGSDYYDLPGVPWNLYFTEGGAVIHGAYWHESFGSTYSHGCVNLPPSAAERLYNWAPLGTSVTVQD